MLVVVGGWDFAQEECLGGFFLQEPAVPRVRAVHGHTQSLAAGRWPPSAQGKLWCEGQHGAVVKGIRSAEQFIPPVAS